MDELKQANECLNDILNGAKKADGAPEIVQNWLKLTIYNLAHDAATRKTKQERQKFMMHVKQTNPLFYDDVSPLAKAIFKDLNK